MLKLYCGLQNIHSDRNTNSASQPEWYPVWFKLNSPNLMQTNSYLRKLDISLGFPDRIWELSAHPQHLLHQGEATLYSHLSVEQTEILHGALKSHKLWSSIHGQRFNVEEIFSWLNQWKERQPELLEVSPKDKTHMHVLPLVSLHIKTTNGWGESKSSY